jgi:hypothetical protein
MNRLMARVHLIDMFQDAAWRSPAVRRRRENRREEWIEQAKLAELLTEHLDPETTFWTSLENKPLSRISGMLQKKRGVRSGLPDVLVIVRQRRPIFVELKSHRGGVSKVQKQIRAEMLPAGVRWWMARSARAALMALHHSGVPFRCKWEPPRLERWEGPFADPTHRLPQHPVVAAERAAAANWYRERKREQEATRLAAE